MVKGKIDKLLAEGKRLKDEKHFDEKGQLFQTVGLDRAVASSLLLLTDGKDKVDGEIEIRDRV